MNFKVGECGGIYHDDVWIGRLDSPKLEEEVVAALNLSRDHTALHFTELQKSEREQFVNYLRADLGCAENEAVRPAIRRLKDELAAVQEELRQAKGYVRGLLHLVGDMRDKISAMKIQEGWFER